VTAEFRAWWLPGYSPGSARDGEDDWTGESPYAGPEGPVVRAPRLSDEQSSEIAGTVRAAAQRARVERSHAQVVRSVSRAAVRLADPADRIGREAQELLGAWLGWSDPVLRESLEGMARDWTEESLHRLVAAELRDPRLLSGFVADDRMPGRRRMATGPPLVLQVHAGNVPGVQVGSAILSLIARSGVLAKSGSDEPWLLPLFARALAEEDPLLGNCLAVTWWPGDSSPPTFARWAKESGKVVVYGGDTAVRAVRERAPADTEVIVYGPRTGVAVLLPDAPQEAARLLARDALAYEQRGCVSPRLVYVVGSKPLEVARDIARALHEASERRGRPPISDGEAVQLRNVRAAWEFQGIAHGDAVALGPADLSWTVLARETPGIEAMALPRALWVYGVRDLAGLRSVLQPLTGRIQGLGYAGHAGEEELAALATELGVSRVCPVGRMAWPPPDWRQEGRHRLLPLLIWTEWESSE
jgi:acyl-CoA reductase-like NAD-dependent aldehyde dehydrogenase